MLVLAVLWIFFAGLVGAAASARGRDGFGWFVLALIITPVFSILLLIAFPVLERAPALSLDRSLKDMPSWQTSWTRRSEWQRIFVRLAIFAVAIALLAILINR